MSEPSPEAKQEAKKWWQENGRKPIYDSAEVGFRYGYDTATAKLREELEHKSAVAQSWFEKYQQLAHQQPSGVEAVRSVRDEWEHREGDQQPSAPLIAALEDIAWGGNRPVDELRSIACAALTGTGEKECPK